MRVTSIKPTLQRTYVRLQFDLPAKAADEASALLVANRALGCEVSKIRPVHPMGPRRPRQVRLKAYFERLNDNGLQRVRRVLESAALITASTDLQTESISDPG